jgi:hypothetical protein
VGFVLAASSPARLPGFALRLGLGRTVTIVKQIQKSFGEPLRSLASTAFYSALPIKLGPYAIHYGIFPAARPEPLPARFDPNHLGAQLAARLVDASVRYDLRVQFYVDDERRRERAFGRRIGGVGGGWARSGRTRRAPLSRSEPRDENGSQRQDEGMRAPRMLARSARSWARPWGERLIPSQTLAAMIR